MNEEARKKRNEYMRNYRKEHREIILEQEKKRRKENPERFKKYRENYWEKKLQEGL